MGGFAGGVLLSAQSRTIWDGVFTEEQAKRGKQRYEAACAYCHMDDLSGGGGDEPGLAPPALIGPEFLAAWRDANVAQVVGTIAATMPFERAKLDRQAYVDIVSYLFQTNGFPAGAAELPVAADELKQIAIVLK
jgi:mono/diheme cytochrome c family protein